MSSLRLVPEPRPLAPVIPIAGRTPSGALAREIARLAAERRLAARPSASAANDAGRGLSERSACSS